MHRKTRWAWYLLLVMIGTISAEALSGSTPIVFPLGVFVLIAYGLHYLLIFDFLVARDAITLRSLAVGGVVVGFTTESLLTKVIWNPPWDEGGTLRILGLGVYEVGFIVMVWHAWMSMALPFALTLTAFGGADILTSRQVRRALRALPLALAFIPALGGVSPALTVPIVLLNGAGIMLCAWWWRRQQREHPLINLADLRLARRERHILWVLILTLYALIIPHRSEAFPAAGPFVLGMLLVAGSIVLLAAVRRADAGQTPAPGVPRYSHRAFARYLGYCLLVGLPLAALGAITAPASTVLLLLGAFIALIIGNRYMLRLAWRTLPLLRRSRLENQPVFNLEEVPDMKLRFWKRDKPKRERTGTRRAVFTLLILAPLCGEMLSGSMPPLEWIVNPFGVLLITMLYGSGALLIREFVHRWGKGWPSVLLLGLAYGIYEEGLVVRSFFDPTWGDLDRLAWYGRALGVNWVWTLNLTWFHATISTAIPILIVERLLYPELRDRPWLTRRGMKIHGLLFGSMLIIGIGFEMHAPPLGYVACAGAMAALWWLARRWPEPDAARVQAAAQQVPRPRRVWLFGLLSMIGLFITLWVIPGLETPALIGVAASLALPVIAVRRGRRLGVWAWGPREQWAVAAGAMSFWTGLAWLAVAGPTMPLAGLGFTVFLWRLRRRVWQRTVPPPDAARLVPPSDVPVPAGS